MESAELVLDRKVTAGNQGRASGWPYPVPEALLTALPTLTYPCPRGPSLL